MSGGHLQREVQQRNKLLAGLLYQLLQAKDGSAMRGALTVRSYASHICSATAHPRVDQADL